MSHNNNNCTTTIGTTTTTTGTTTIGTTTTTTGTTTTYKSKGMNTKEILLNVLDALDDMYELSEDEIDEFVDEFVDECLFERLIVFSQAARECLDTHATQCISELTRLYRDVYHERKSRNKEDE